MRLVAVAKRAKLDRNLYASNLLFAQTTHVDLAPEICTRSTIPEIVIYFKLRENRLRYRGVVSLVWVENRRAPLTWLMAYTTACINVQYKP